MAAIVSYVSEQAQKVFGNFTGPIANINYTGRNQDTLKARGLSRSDGVLSFSDFTLMPTKCWKTRA